MVGLLLDGAEAAVAPIGERKAVIAVERVACPPAAVGGDVGVDVLAQCIRKVHLSGEHVLLVGEHLEMDVGGAALVPAGIDGAERDLAARVDQLRAAHEGAACRVDGVILTLAAVAGIEAVRACVPDIDACTGDGLAGAGVQHHEAQSQRRARMALGDVHPLHLGVEIIGAFDRLWRQDAARLQTRRRRARHWRRHLVGARGDARHAERRHRRQRGQGLSLIHI